MDKKFRLTGRTFFLLDVKTCHPSRRAAGISDNTWGCFFALVGRVYVNMNMNLLCMYVGTL